MSINEIIEILETDLHDLPRLSQYDEGFAAGVVSAIILLKRAAKENKGNE